MRWHSNQTLYLIPKQQSRQTSFPKFHRFHISKHLECILVTSPKSFQTRSGNCEFWLDWCPMSGIAIVWLSSWTPFESKDGRLFNLWRGPAIWTNRELVVCGSPYHFIAFQDDFFECSNVAAPTIYRYSFVIVICDRNIAWDWTRIHRSFSCEMFSLVRAGKCARRRCQTTVAAS